MLALLALAALPAFAQEAPACGPEREGQTACLAGKLCLCRFERGGQLTGRGDRFAWDCGALRPLCPPEQNVVQPPGWMPPAGIWVAPGPRPRH
ncbi:hypothetical protein GXW77_07750 [Roseomonas alkaliterrae]|uniref:Uncharacterized protein n=1 Tax=Neoroseomonas alkaliterrae TaxID=1452450 RepID=A0A840XVT2_9PROT|nr:hypothetical protein [Neoroseomonas alkaliterrae]MBB5688247.1 hypothetical protein [Neoroseomonas alkaliterrae]MBR0676067.1 hypothetical protein [Neoroseomonas alkaliterrae]